MRKKIFTLSIMAIFAIGILPAQDLEKILDSYFETIGQEKLLKVESMISTGTIQQMGMEMPFKVISKRPDKAYMEAEIQGSKMKQGYDGENGWIIQPWTGSSEPIDVTGPELSGLKEMADMDGKLWNYEEKGHQLELVGKEDMEGAEVFVLKLTEKDGNISHMYIDSENYVILKVKSKIVMQDSEVEMEAIMSNYQDIDGYIMPFTTQQLFNGTIGMTLNIEEVKYNEEIDDSIFDRPIAAEKPVEE